MKIYNFRIIFEDVIKRWYLVILLAIVCGGGLGFYGYRSAKNASPTDNGELAAQWEAYDAAIAEYEQSVENTQKALDDNQRILDDLNTYIENSIYMQIDSQDVKTSTAIYAIKAGEGVDFNTLISAYYLYVTGGAIYEDIAASGIEIKEQYLKELILWANSNNTFTITVIAPDEETSAKILSACDKALRGKYEEFRNGYGYYDIELTDESHFSKADTGIMGAQDGQLNSRRSYQTTMSDLENRLVGAKNTLANYRENEKPETEVTGVSPKKNLIKFGVFGAIIGVVLSFAMAFLSYFFGRRLKSAKDLAAIDVDVLATYDLKKGYKPETEDVLLSVKTYCDIAGSDKMCLMTVADTEDIKKASGALVEALGKKSKGFSLKEADYFGSRAEALRELTSSGQVILLLQKGRSTYADIEGAVKLCGQFDVKVRGCIVLQ